MAAKKETAKEVVNFQKKLSTKKIVGKVLVRELEEGDNDLYEIVGIASGIKTGSTDYGEYAGLTGNFAARNIKTGESFRSGVAFLPDVANDPIIGQLQAGASAVEFGWIIGVKTDDESTVGYVYYARPLIEADENDPLELLAAKMGTTPALEDKSDSKK